MYCLAKNLCLFLTTISSIFLFSGNVFGQLELKWSLETPAGENHKFRDIATNASGKLLYISDSYSDVVYIFKSDKPDEPVGSFGVPSWQGWPGPYGIDIADDQKIYIAVMLIDDNDGNRIEDYSLWQCLPHGKNLRRICNLPDAPRGIKVIGGGKNTVVYVSGSNGKVIKCSPVKLPYEFEAEIIFETGIVPQQDVLPTNTENICYTSGWWDPAPDVNVVIKWNYANGIWEKDNNFTPSLLESSNYPGIELNRSQNSLYVFQIGFLDLKSHLFKINAETGDAVDFCELAEGANPGDGSTGAGGIDVTKKNEVYFAGAFGIKDGNFISVYGKVNDLNPAELIRKGSYEGNQKLVKNQRKTTCFALKNYPNPFNPTTLIHFNLAEAAQVNLSVYNSAGQLIKTLLSNSLEAGDHSFQWDATNDNGHTVAAGIYLCRIQAGEFVDTKQMVLMK